MTRLFRRPGFGIAGWISLGVFAAAYLAALALVLIPGLAGGSP
jgi:hypothetical protein